MLRKFVIAAICIFSFGAQAITSLNPYQLVEQVAQKTLHRIEADSRLIETDSTHLNKIVSKELMPYVDYRLASKIVLDKVNPQDELRDEFYQAFERYLVATYAAIFSKYDGQKLLLDAAKDINGKKVVSVKGKLRSLDERDIDIEFKLRLNQHTLQWSVFDIVVEGISMLNSKKAELQPILRQHDGVRTAINILNKKSGITKSTL